MTSPTILQALEQRLPASSVITNPNLLAERSHGDWSSAPRHMPLALIKPKSTEELAQALTICNQYRQTVVPQGGLTGLAGGACCHPDDIAISLERMNAIEDIDTVSGTITVQAGVLLQHVQAAAENAGYFFALDLGARGSCTIGGNLATNAGGNRVVRYGMAREQLLGLEVVLANGSVLSSLHKMIKNNAGYDMKHLFIGSEGTLGIITRAVLKLRAQPQAVATAWCGLPSFDAVTTLLRRAQAQLTSGVSVFEVMWPNYLTWVNENLNINNPLNGAHNYYVLLETTGANDTVTQEGFTEFLSTMVDEGIVTDGVLAQSLAEAQAFWKIRDAPEHFNQLLPHSINFDISFAIKDIDQAATQCSQLLQQQWSACTVLTFGHLGDGNIHILVHVPNIDSSVVAQIEQSIYQIVRTLDGSISAEHGVGYSKRQYLPHARNANEINTMQLIKGALDPNGILNRGKIFTTDNQAA